MHTKILKAFATYIHANRKRYSCLDIQREAEASARSQEDMVVEIAKQFNPRFDECKFRNACHGK